MCSGCTNLHRHQIHLISYGCVSFCLITTGLLFTVFAVFQKDSQIGKVWLAGPTTMVVGLVLCGKVIIDWGPAMMHAHQRYSDYSIDGITGGITPLRWDDQHVMAFKDPITVPYLSDQNIRLSMANGVVKAAPSDVPSDLVSSRKNTRHSSVGCAVHPYRTRGKGDMRRMLTSSRIAMDAHPHSSQCRPNCHHHYYTRNPFIIATNSHATGSSHNGRNDHQPTLSGLQARTPYGNALSQCVTEPLLSTAERNRLQHCLTVDSLYGAVTGTMERAADRCTTAHNGYCYQGETFVLNHRNYLI